MKEFIYNVLSQKAIVLNEDHHLFFEKINEHKLRGFPNEWWYDSTNSTNEESAIIQKNKLLFSIHMYTTNDSTMKPDISLIEFTLFYRGELFGKMGGIDNNNTQERIASGKLLSRIL